MSVCPRKRTCAVHWRVSAKGQKRTLHCCATLSQKRWGPRRSKVHRHSLACRNAALGAGNRPVRRQAQRSGQSGRTVGIQRSGLFAKALTLRKTAMTRTKRNTLTFRNIQARLHVRRCRLFVSAGAYELVTDKELIKGLSFLRDWHIDVHFGRD